MTVEFSLTTKEAQVLELLLRFHKSLTCPSAKDIRIAGGWVRDKLMLTRSNDMDIVLEDCTGVAFADAFQRWLYEEKGIKELQTAIIRANPEKSKHLETAMLSLVEFGLSLDFVNLRSEKYTETSRIPEMEFGTPKEDACRRDFTINALFYNIVRQEVEDFTGKGLDDLSVKILRTPLDAKQTFLDDPLRLIRAARFLAKLQDFTPHVELEVAAGQLDVLAALKEKVSMERIRAEVAKMTTYGEACTRGFYYLSQWHVLPVIFDSHSSSQKITKKRKKNYELPLPEAGFGDQFDFGFKFLEIVTLMMQRIRQTQDYSVLSQECIFWDLEKFNTIDLRGAVTFMILLMLRFREDCLDPDKKGVISAAELAVIRMKSRGVSQSMMTLYTVLLSLFRIISEPLSRRQVMDLLRVNGVSRWWELALLVAATYQRLIDEWNPEIGIYFEPYELTRDQMDCDGELDSEKHVVPARKPEQLKKNDWPLTWDNAGLNVFYQAITAVIRTTKYTIKTDWDVYGIWALRPLLGGKEVKQLLPQIPEGPLFGQVMKFQIDWLCDNYTGSGDMESKTDDLKNALMSRFG
eukprot:Gregarina_sp_Poly_1__5077@NODE_2691_length_1818_cov_25_964021_g1708_i0_p1_GENE_NODE_2691_length_1818_cov_25_964021_g1708_i0NODE_2691_length_1818_cov_25_964021_g1708_i0_p1_ORF_typecomplete_len594_score89_73PolyA_pol/PF01743_20/2_1e29PolyA_pol_RNAbd/PF12627_7/0_00024_NODE_2691_length_1818_cov_25_964021_g1708_i0541784